MTVLILRLEIYSQIVIDKAARLQPTKRPTGTYMTKQKFDNLKPGDLIVSVSRIWVILSSKLGHKFKCHEVECLYSDNTSMIGRIETAYIPEYWQIYNSKGE